MRSGRLSAMALMALASTAAVAHAQGKRAFTLADWYRLSVLDRGSGMSDATLASALIPFYSTKRSGTGLGLPLAREIAEAHGGRIALLNREGGGLCVAMSIPE